MNLHASELLFWICIGAVAYNYAGYPVLLFVLSMISQAKSDLLYLLSRNDRRCQRLTDEPRVALLVSAYNEEAVIGAKLENCLRIDYPSDRLEVLFGLDAPTDSTAELLGRFPHPQVRVSHYNNRRGKLAVLCDLVQQTSAKILVLTDANTMLHPGSIRNIVRHFANPKVGAVSGEEIRIAAPGTDPSAESLYWRHESALKILESRVNCSLGGNGAALAVRRSLFKPVRQSIIEDLQIPLEIRFQGFRVVYDPEVIAVEEITPTFSAQFCRRVRIGAGNYQTLFRNPEYLNPLKGLLAFSFISHRLLRWLGPLFLLIAFFCSIAWATQPTFAAFLVLQGFFYSAAVVGYLRKKRGKPAGLFSVPLHFCSMNLALLLGLYTYLRGRQGVVWRVTPRNVTPIPINTFANEHRGNIRASETAEHRPAA